ncbi:MAG: hypothetical protein CMJ72_04660 [Planctomycetaceae bacterium]|nr:hypothetical protein [Planctomycetaceae bacterium]
MAPKLLYSNDLGATQSVRFELTKKELAFWNVDLQQAVEPGELSIWVAPHSRAGIPVKIKLTTTESS